MTGRIELASASPVPERPSLAPWFRLLQEGDRVLLEHGGALVSFEGRAAERLLPVLLPLLDGRRTVPEIVAELGTPIEASVVNALELLATHRLLLEGPPALDGVPEGEAEAAAFAAVGREASVVDAHRVLTRACVTVAGSGLGADPLVELLADAGIDCARGGIELAGKRPDLLIVAPGRDPQLLERVNELRLADGVPWFQLLPYDGRFVAIGPLFLPGESACRRCYEMRRAANSDFEDDYDRLARATVRAPAPQALTAAAAAIAALLAIRWLGRGDPSLPGRLYALETGRTMHLTVHHVLRVPRCPACGPCASALPSPWYLERASAG